MCIRDRYNVLKSVTYTPCKVAVPSGSGLACGQIVHLSLIHISLATVVGIRHKLAKGQKLEKWEQQFYRENKEIVDLRPQLTKERCV